VTPLELTEWTLVELAGAAVELRAGDVAPFLALDPDASRVSGSGGCNRLVGTVEREGDALCFRHLVTTRMACTERVMQREAAFLGALAATSRFQLSGDSLALLDRDDPVAILRAQE
jgi:heat shock protein HslJ